MVVFVIFPGANYNEATDSIVEELLDIDKPFIIIIITKDVMIYLPKITKRLTANI